MCEALYRHHQAVLRLFGPSARLTGSIGSRRGPGDVRILVDGRQLGTGRTFGQALQDASTTAGQRFEAGCAATPPPTGCGR